MAAVVLAGELPDAGGGLAWAAAVAVAVAREADAAPIAGGDGAVRPGRGGRRAFAGPDDARRRRGSRARARAARGAASRPRPAAAWPGCGSAAEDGWLDRLAEAVTSSAAGARAVVVCLPPARSARGARRPRGSASPACCCAPSCRASARSRRSRSRELRAAGACARGSHRGPPAGSRRGARWPGSIPAARPHALARGCSAAQPSARPGRARSRREAGQALPLVLGGLLALVLCTLILAAFGGAVTGTSRVQRAADLAALSAARSMRDDFERLFEPARSPGGSAEPGPPGEGGVPRPGVGGGASTPRGATASIAARLRVEFPDSDSFAPLRVRAPVTAELETAGRAARLAGGRRGGGGGGRRRRRPATAGGPGGRLRRRLLGPLVYRQGEGMRPDVAAAFDRHGRRPPRRRRLAAGQLRLPLGRRAGGALGPASRPALGRAAGHVAAPLRDRARPRPAGGVRAGSRRTRERFGFLQRYAWEAWHYGFVDGSGAVLGGGDEVGPRRTAPADGARGRDQPARLRPGALPRRARGRRAALERLRGAAGRAAAWPSRTSTRSRSRPPAPPGSPSSCRHRGRVRARRPVRRRGRDRRPGPPDGRPAARSSARSSSPSPPTTRARRRWPPATASLRSPRPRPTWPGSSASWAAPGRSPWRRRWRCGWWTEAAGDVSVPGPIQLDALAYPG